MDLDPNEIRRLVEQLTELNRNITANKEVFESSASAARDSSKKTSDEFSQSTRAIVNAIAALGTRIEGLSQETKISSRDRRTENQKIEDFTASVEKTTKSQIDAIKATEEREKAEADAEEATRKRIAAEEEATRIAKMTAKERREYEREQRKSQQKADDDSNRQMLKKGLEEGNLRTQLTRKNLLEAQNIGSKFFDQMSSLGNSTDFVRDQVKDSFAGFITKMGGGAKSLIVFEGATKFAGAALEGVAKGLTSYTGALYSGERGFTASAKAMTETIKPMVEFVDMLGNIISFASIFVPGGLLVKGAVALGGQLLKLAGRAAEAAAKLNELQAEQLDKTFKAFRDISSVGAATAGGLEDVFDSMQKLGLTTAEIEQFTEVIKANSRTFALFGGDVANGRMQFQEVANTLIKSNLGVELERLGMTTKEQTKATAGYMNIQARLGTLQNKSIEQLAKESARYARELDELARLTGMSREEAEQARMQAMAEDQFRAAIEMAEETGDKAFKQQLDNAQMISQLLKSQGREEDAKEILRLAASRGAPTSERQGAMLLSGYGEALRAGSQEEAIRTLEKTLGAATKQFQGIAQYVPGRELPLPYAAERDLLALIKGKSPEETAKIVAEQMQKVSGRTEAAIGIEREQKDMAQKLDSAAFKLLNVAEMHAKAAKHLNDAADTLIKWTGSKSATVAGGGFSRAGAVPATPAADTKDSTAPARDSGTAATPAQMPPGTSAPAAIAPSREKLQEIEKTADQQKSLKRAEISKTKGLLEAEEEELKKMYARAESTDKILAQSKKIQDLKTKQQELQQEFNDIERKKVRQNIEEFERASRQSKERQKESDRLQGLKLRENVLAEKIAENTQKRVALEQELKDKTLRPAYRQRKEKELQDINKEAAELQTKRETVKKQVVEQQQKVKEVEAPRKVELQKKEPSKPPARPEASDKKDEPAADKAAPQATKPVPAPVVPKAEPEAAKPAPAPVTPKVAPQATKPVPAPVVPKAEPEAAKPTPVTPKVALQTSKPAPVTPKAEPEASKPAPVPVTPKAAQQAAKPAPAPVVPKAELAAQPVTVPTGPAAVPPPTAADIAASVSTAMQGPVSRSLGKSAANVISPSEQGPGTLDEKISDLNKIFTFTANTGSMQSFDNLDTAFKQQVIAAAIDYNALTGNKIQINSAHRELSDQQRLWEETVSAGRPGIGPTGDKVARPSPHSPHVQGIAVDIQNYADLRAVEAFNKNGLFQRVPNDKVHFSAADGGIIPAAPGGRTVLAAEAGLNEAFVPLPDGRNIPVTLNVEELISKMQLKEVDIANNTTEVLQNTVTKMVETARASGVSEESLGRLASEFSSMNDKLAQMLDVLSSSREIQSSLLTTSMN